jgi:predicted HicB family RNase H-like nuclease
MNMMKYGGYIATVEYDEEDRIFVGHLAGIGDIVGFHGASVDELERAFHEAVDNYLAISEETGRSPQRPFSGELTLHLTPDTHAAVAVAAERRGKNIDQWASDVLDQAARA